MTAVSGSSSSKASATSSAVVSKNNVVDLSNVESCLPSLISVWECKYVTKSVGCWTCGWCGLTARPNHSQRALAHLLKIKGNKIRLCSAIIPEENLAAYRQLFSSSADGVARRKNVKTAQEVIMTDHHNATLEKVLVGKRMSQASISSFVSSEKKPTQSKRHGSSVHMHNQPSITAAIQRSEQQDLRVCNNSKLTVAICNMIYADGLPFSFIQSRRLAEVLRLAKLVDSTYCVPTRNAVSGELLELSYQSAWEVNKQLLISEGETFGISMLGDGATISKMPLINILCMQQQT